MMQSAFAVEPSFKEYPLCTAFRRLFGSSVPSLTLPGPKAELKHLEIYTVIKTTSVRDGSSVGDGLALQGKQIGNCK